VWLLHSRAVSRMKIPSVTMCLSIPGIADTMDATATKMARLLTKYIMLCVDKRTNLKERGGEVEARVCCQTSWTGDLPEMQW